MDSVQVALRIRPLSSDELDRGCRSCIDTYPQLQQVRITKKSFTYNHVFDHGVSQSDVYESAVKNLVQQLFKGYNVTVLAYGQTGSGKTFSMGTNYPSNTDKGIIPRAVDDIFDRVLIDEEWDFKIRVSFIELYNEQLYDLLSDKPRDQCIVDIRDDGKGSVHLPGLTEVNVTTTDETLQCLQKGSTGRATGSTAMNSQSSRSHAIFTIYINQTRRDNDTDSTSAKFHLVDLAGSERSKKTKAVGKIFKEGVHINKELFILGNVISALGEGNSFVNYRDSKITRLLQDSLGGNAYTIMIACVSPADDNISETLSTLKYADRARKIKNKPIVNQDPKSAEIARLVKENEELKLELLARGGVSGGVRVNACPPEHEVLMQKIKTLTDALGDSLAQNAAMSERALMAEKARDIMKEKLYDLTCEYSCIEEAVKTTLNETQLEKFQTLKSCINDIQDLHQKSVDEMKCHERSVINMTPENSPKAIRKDLDKTPGEDVEQREQFLLEQTKLSQQLQELSKNLAWKEHLVSNMVSSASQITKMQSISENNVMELEQQIEALQKEKEELMNQMKSITANANTNKLAEQRRKRLQELEQKITTLTKKVTEQARIIKMKESTDQKLVSMNKEILTMKQMKVRLINQMKMEGEKYRAWKAERDREVYKLRQQVGQRQTQISRLEHKHLKERNVLKRKFEEAAAVNKRLKDALSLQKAVQGKRQLMGNPERISQWINQELEIMLSTMEAERSLEHLIEDRATLNKTLQTLKAKLNEPSLSEEEKVVLQQEVKELNQNLDLRSTQIIDLKQKIEDSDQENKAKTRWETLQSMVDAKFALKCLFDAVASAKKDSTSKDATLQEIHDLHSEVLNTLKIKEEQILEQQKAMRKLEQEYEEKVIILLRQLKENGIALNSEQMLAIQEDELSKMDELRQNLDHWMKKCEELEKIIAEQKPLTAIENKPAAKKASKVPKPILTSDLKTPENKVAKQIEFLTPGNISPEDDDDDDENDPDWTKTPLYKRLQSLKQRSKLTRNLKRSVDGMVKCMCRSDCSKRMCTCKKSESKCSADCKCSVEICTNRELQQIENVDDDNDSETSSRSIKKMKFDPDASPDLTDAVSTTFTTANSSIPKVSPELNATFAVPSNLNATFTM